MYLEVSRVAIGQCLGCFIPVSYQLAYHVDLFLLWFFRHLHSVTYQVPTPWQHTFVRLIIKANKFRHDRPIDIKQQLRASEFSGNNKLTTSAYGPVFWGLFTEENLKGFTSLYQLKPEQLQFWMLKRYTSFINEILFKQLQFKIFPFSFQTPYSLGEFEALCLCDFFIESLFHTPFF